MLKFEPPLGPQRLWNSTSMINKQLINVPKTITRIDTGYKYLHSVTCVNDVEIWTSGEERNWRLYNIQDDLVRSIETKKGNIPRDIAVENSGNIVYTLGENQSVYRIRNISTQIEKVIQLDTA